MNGCDYGNYCSIYDDDYVLSGLAHGDGPVFACHLTENAIHQFSKKVSHLGGTWRGVQVIRHPVEMVISSYIYHQKTTWDCRDCDCVALKQLNMTEGLLMQAECIRPELDKMVQAYQASQEEPRMLVLQLEDFIESSSSFDKQIRSMFEHFGGHNIFPFDFGRAMDMLQQDASRFDLHRNPSQPAEPHLLASDVDKDALQEAYTEVMGTNIFKQVQMYARKLGYDPAPATD